METTITVNVWGNLQTVVIDSETHQVKINGEAVGKVDADGDLQLNAAIRRKGDIPAGSRRAIFEAAMNKSSTDK